MTKPKQSTRKTPLETVRRSLPLNVLARVTGGGNFVITKNGDFIWIG